MHSLASLLRCSVCSTQHDMRAKIARLFNSPMQMRCEDWTIYMLLLCHQPGLRILDSCSWLRANSRALNSSQLATSGTNENEKLDSDYLITAIFHRLALTTRRLLNRKSGLLLIIKPASQSPSSQLSRIIGFPIRSMAMDAKSTMVIFGYLQLGRHFCFKFSFSHPR